MTNQQTYHVKRIIHAVKDEVRRHFTLWRLNLLSRM